MDEYSENYNQDWENIRKNQSELKNTITEMKNTLEWINSRLDDTEEWISNQEDRVIEITQPEQQKEEKNFLKEDNLRYLWATLSILPFTL